MLLNCTRVKHVYTTLQITQIHRDGPRVLINAICRSGAHNGNGLQLLQRRSYNYLYKIRTKAGVGADAAAGGTAGAGSSANCRWSARLLNIRGGNLSIKGRRNNSGCKAAEEPKPSKSKPKLGDYQRLFTLIKTEKKALLCMASSSSWLFAFPLWLINGTISVGIGCLFISSAITMSVPHFLGKVIDVLFNKEGLTMHTLDKLREHSLMLFCLFAVGGLANFARVYLFGAACKYEDTDTVNLYWFSLFPLSFAHCASVTPQTL